MTSGGGGGGGTPYIGSKISLISKAEIRYEGILYDVNTKDSTVTLSKVRSHGTEGRPAVKPVQPRSEVYEYIIFRGSDIKDLSVNEVAKSSEEPQDPAILSTHSSPPVSSQTQAPPTAPPTTVPASVPPPTTVPNPPGLPLQAPPTHHSIPPIYNNPFSLGAMGAGSSYNPFPYLGRPPFLLNQPGGGVMGGSKPVPVPQRISSSTPANQATPPNSESVSIIAATTQSKAGPVAEGTPPNTSSASSINTSTPNTGSTISPLQNSISASDSSWSRPSVSEGMALPPDPAITDSSHDNEDTEEPSEQTAPHTGGAGGGGGGGRKTRQFKERGGGSAGRGGPHRQPRPHSGGPKTSSESAPPNGVVAKKPLRYDSDFDFDIANALFSKETIEKEIKEKLKITTGDRQQATGDEAAAPLRWEGPGEEVGGANEGLLQEEEDPVQSYDKEVSFFDNISCEANTSNKKYNRSEERALNTETFGITSRGPPRGGRARGGRGQRGRGYSRGGGRPDRTYRHDDGYGQQRDGHYRNRGGSYRGRGRNDYYGDSYGRNDYHGDGYRGRGDPHGDSYRGRGNPHGDSYRGRGDPHGDSYRGRGDPHGDGYRGRGDPQGDGYRGRDNYHGDGYRGRGGYHGNDNRGRKDHYGNAYHRSDYPRSREY